MIEIDIPSIDPIQHEPKIFLGMTSRQCLCIVPSLALGVGGFVLGQSVFHSLDVSIVLLLIFVIPGVLMGWYAPYNMKFEDYVRLVWFNTFVANQKRIYKTDSAEEVKLMTMKERQLEEQRMRDKELMEKKQKKQANNKGKNR